MSAFISATLRPGATIAGFVFAAVLAIGVAGPADAELLQLGGSFQVMGTDAPNTFSENDILTLGTTSIDGGLLNLTLTTMPAAGGEEWIIFTFQTATGASIAGVLNAAWEIQVENVPISTPSALYSSFYLDLGTNGVLTNPDNNTGFNLTLETNPVTGSGTVFGQTGGFDVENPFYFGFLYVDTFSSHLSSWGLDPATVNEFQMGALMEPIGGSTSPPSPTQAPEPASGILLLSAFAALGAARRRSAGQPVAAR
jgi:hypothetical protein